MRFKTVLAGVSLLCCFSISTVLAQASAEAKNASSTPVKSGAQLSDDPADSYLVLWGVCKKGEKLEDAGQLTDALQSYLKAERMAGQFTTRFPSWSPPVVDYRRKRIQEAIARIAVKLDQSAAVKPPAEPFGQASAAIAFKSAHRIARRLSRPDLKLVADPADRFLIMWQHFQKAKKLEEAGDLPAALETYQEVKRMIDQLDQGFPEWNPRIVDFRRNRILQAITGVSEKIRSKGLPQPEASTIPLPRAQDRLAFVRE